MTKRVRFLVCPLRQCAASGVTSIRIHKGIGMVAPVVDKRPTDVAVHVGDPGLRSTLSVQTDGLVVAKASTRPSYTSVVMLVILVYTRPRNVTRGGCVPSPGEVGPQPISADELVIYGTLKHVSVDEIFWQTSMLKLEGSKQVVRACRLIRLYLRGSKMDSCLVMYFSNMVQVHILVLSFGGQWCSLKRYEFARMSVPLTCAHYVQL